ncbi:MAG: thioredoxin family protein [Gammaproteobacteria bacterium]|nr:thioredoxin family protein [Gammaproteobacteria bacterium]
MKKIESTEQLNEQLNQFPITALYFSGSSCGVCHALRPKVEALFTEEFPQAPLLEIATDEQPELAAQYGVFTLPVLILYIDGREGSRFARTFSLGEVREALERPYNMIFE